MKAAPIITAIHQHNRTVASQSVEQDEVSPETIRHILVHTGQHYDDLMSGSFFSDLNLPEPNVHLGIGSGSHAAQTAEIMKKFERVLFVEKPDVVIVVGDVNSTVACAMATAKVSFNSHGFRPVLAHVEAGLRSFDRTMPEEINRVVTDHLSDLLFVTEQSGLRNLRREGISPDKLHFVGNTMIDSLLTFIERAEDSSVLEKLGLRVPSENGKVKESSRYALLTLHRPSNVDNRDTLTNILSGLEELAKDQPIIFPAHPRTQQRIKDFGLQLSNTLSATKTGNAAPELLSKNAGIVLIDPLGYLDFLSLLKHAAIVVTDSGGIQEETTCLRIPCVTVRENTERPVTLESGTNIIAGTTKEGIKEAIRAQIERKPQNSMPEHWDGHAADRILETLIRTHVSKAVLHQDVGSLACP